MNRKCLILAALIILLMPSVFAKEISFSTDQSDYYFLTGEQAAINLNTVNTYKNPITGLLAYTLTQEIRQQGFQYSSSNTQSNSFTIEKGKNVIPLSFGASDSPMTLTVSMIFSYTEKDQMEVSLDNIKIHFVNDESEKSNDQNPMESSSKKAGQKQKQDTLNQQNQQMQKDSSQRLQNSQLPQDSSALKQQIQKQLQEQQKLREEFQRQLEKNTEIQSYNQELLQQGYKISNADISPTSNNSGNFQINYKKDNGEEATIKGQMQDGNLTNLHKQTSEDKMNMIRQLKESAQFKKFEKKLQNESFSEQKTEFLQEGNKTNIKIHYKNDKNQTAAIKAEFVNNTITNIELEKPYHKKKYLWILFMLVLLLTIGYLIYKRHSKKKFNKNSQKPEIKEELFDYRSLANSMLKEAKELFKKNHYKDAYGKAGQSLRLFLSYENNLRKEITNDEIIKYLKKRKKSHKETKECFDLCSLVEFAKYKANREDFDSIISHARKIVEGK